MFEAERLGYGFCGIPLAQPLRHGSHIACPIYPRCRGEPVTEIRLLRKYAAVLDGFDLTERSVGDVFFVNEDDAAMLAREGWAEPTTGDARHPLGDEPILQPAKIRRR